MTDQVFQSNLEARTAFKRMTGAIIRLTPYDLFIKVTVKSPTELVATIRVHEIQERRTAVILKNQGTRLVQFNLVNDVWVQTNTFTLWETDFTPIHHSIFGPGKTVGQWLLARQFESMCGRPGSDNHPLDSFQRTVVDGPDYSTKRMARHWA
jgi:hypothetical protein